MVSTKALVSFSLIDDTPNYLWDFCVASEAIDIIIDVNTREPPPMNFSSGAKRISSTGIVSFQKPFQISYCF